MIMSNKYFPHLFSPIKLAEGLELKNRIVMAPMATNFATEHGAPTENQLAYYRLRARKGVALIVTESNYVREDGKNGPTRMGLHSDDVISAHKRLTEAVHEEGGKICAQLHYGGYTISPLLTGRYPLSCSATPLDTKGEIGIGLIPRKMSVKDIRELIECYASAARRATEAGYDAIQIHCAHGYLLNSFLSPHVNKRNDAYGGSDENRMRIVMEIFEAVRQRIGNTFPMSVRFSGEETIDGGYDAQFIIKVISDLERFNLCEASISGGNYEQAEQIAPPHWYKHGYYADVARRIRKRVNVPISTVGRITTPQCAEEIIARGDADLVYLGRELVAFPFFGEAAENGRPVKECLGCGCCFDSMAKGEGLRCTINPFVGQEAAILESEMDRPHARPVPKRVAVIGGGPAGLTAATEAAKQGHDVKLYERDAVVGGKLNLAGRVGTGKEEMLRLIKFLEDEAVAAGAEILHGREITDASQLGNPDLVIVATGGVERQVAIEGLNRWISAEDAIKNPNGLGRRVVIIGGGMVGAELAQTLAQLGKDVSIVEILGDVLIGCEFPNRRGAIQRLCDLGVWIYVNTTILGADDEELTLQFKNRTFKIPYDEVVTATGYVPDSSLLETMQRAGSKVVAIGDCKSPGKILHALHTAVEATGNLRK
jgi:2,4-dienoyl-CoA reductase-like NADH-dependent reductase (Old Yellow Enzyme family)/thioredoxin reductase